MHTGKDQRWEMRGFVITGRGWSETLYMETKMKMLGNTRENHPVTLFAVQAPELCDETTRLVL